MDLSVKIGGKALNNPVGAASGTFGYGKEYGPLCDLNKIGAIYTKAVSLEPRAGNNPPRLVETPAGMLNSIGLANVGVDKFISDKLPFLETLSAATVVNVAGSVEKDYFEVVEKLEDQNGIWGFEINLSCPNVKHGCMAMGADPALVEKLVKELRGLCRKPLIIKLTPNVTDIASIAKAAEAAGADAVSCINTLVGMAIDIKRKKPVLASITGGLSGPAILPVGLACVYKVSRAVKIPVIGIGGINSGPDAVQYLLAGASAIQVGTANFMDVRAAEKVLTGIKDYMEEEKIENLDAFHQFID